MTEKVEISVKDYVESSSEAAKRTRSVSIALMIASVLMFSGFLNSLQSNWKLQRLRNLEDIDSGHTERRLGPRPSPQDSEAYQLYIARYNQLYAATLKDYVESAYTIRIPFFGISIDSNDLGPLGGLALAVILILYRTSVTRELDNLRLSFEAAAAQNQLNTLYTLLAMRQVLTFPNIQGKERSKFMAIVPKLLSILPAFIYLMVVANDVAILTISSNVIFPARVALSLFQEAFYFVIIIIITYMLVVRLIEIDRMWDHYWGKLNEPKAVENIEAYSPVPDA